VVEWVVQWFSGSDKGMPRAPLGLDGVLVALEIVVLVVLVVVVVVVVAPAAVVLLRLVVVLLDRHRNGQRDLLNDRLRVHMCVVLHRHVYSDPGNGRIIHEHCCTAKNI